MEAIRALTVAKRSARSERIQANCQARALIVTGPEDLRARFAAHATADLVTGLASLRPRPALSSATTPGSRCGSWAAAPSSQAARPAALMRSSCPWSPATRQA